MAYRKLNRASGNRKALFRSLSSALIMNGRIETTITKAKETSKNVAKLITLAKVGDLHAGAGNAGRRNCYQKTV